jgi:hypothetical protein
MRGISAVAALAITMIPFGAPAGDLLVKAMRALQLVAVCLVLLQAYTTAGYAQIPDHPDRIDQIGITKIEGSGLAKDNTQCLRTLLIPYRASPNGDPLWDQFGFITQNRCRARVYYRICLDIKNSIDVSHGAVDSGAHSLYVDPASDNQIREESIFIPNGTPDVGRGTIALLRLVTSLDDDVPQCKLPSSIRFSCHATALCKPCQVQGIGHVIGSDRDEAAQKALAEAISDCKSQVSAHYTAAQKRMYGDQLARNRENCVRSAVVNCH